MIDLEAILTPFAGDNPAGENLRYMPTYDAIQEARREEDALDRGEWDRDIKTADWQAVKKLAYRALIENTKDIQIAVWLLEALVKTEGFKGLKTGLQVLCGLMENFWDNLYPEIEDDDLDFRVGPLAFMNDKLWLAVKQVPLTDPGAGGGGFSWLKWQEATEVGTDASAKAEGKLGIEDFEKALSRSSKAFYEDLNGQIDQCVAAFTRLDNLLDRQFGKETPRTAEFKQALEECQRFIAKTLKQKKELDPDPDGETDPEEAAGGNAAADSDDDGPAAAGSAAVVATAASVQGQIVVGLISDTEPHEEAVWNSALSSLKNDGIKRALDTLFSASCSVSSSRSKNRYRLLMAKLCLQADRHDLARPIAEELNALVAEMGLERWESPVWVADVLGVLYRCLSHAAKDSEDYSRAEEIFKKMCTIDLTKALQHRQK
ncbi:type VI secretion system protein TssA [Desulfosarcina sp.]|uniref:type VI secretion system protein TssA n=1 Tax=Desulfosarcina sp. TaxID=2027861 RepID=UPI0039708EC1